MTTEDEFQRQLDDHPDDWHTRLVFADWLDDRDDPRAAGYRAIARRKRCPTGTLLGGQLVWWWRRVTLADRATGVSTLPRGVAPMESHYVPSDWFDRLPSDRRRGQFWPVPFLSRGVCEDALALAFAQLPDGRRLELLQPDA